MRIRFLHTEGFRLSAIYACVFAVSVLAMGTVALLLTDQALREQIVQSSRTDIAAIQKGYDNEGDDEAREVVGQLMGAPGGSDYFLMQKNAHHVAGNLPAIVPQAGIVSLSAARGHDDILGVGAWLEPGLYVFSGSSLKHAQDTHARILGALLWLFAGSLLLAALGGFFVSRSFLRRMDAMTRTCRFIMDGDMKARIPTRGTQDELDQLADAVNTMLDRIVALMENVGQVTNDIAHDLRTPVTHLRHRLERARAESISVADFQRAMDAAIEKVDDILALFTAMLRIVQIEGKSRQAMFASVELSSLLRQVYDLFAPVAEAANHHLAIALDGAVTMRGDRALLVQLLSNLIENAIIHTPEGTHIGISLAHADDRALVTVHDDGPGVPAEEHVRLFRRLYRREASRMRPGYGLGLSMVSAIAELHGAVAKIEPAEKGFSITVSFPAVA